MIITDKDLGLIIIGEGIPSSISNNQFQLVNVMIDSHQYHLAIQNGDSFYDWKYVTEDVAKEFCSLFTYKKYVVINKDQSLYHSEKYDIIFEGEEESLLYWRLKYIDI